MGEFSLKLALENESLIEIIHEALVGLPTNRSDFINHFIIVITALTTVRRYMTALTTVRRYMTRSMLFKGVGYRAIACYCCKPYQV